MANAPARVSPTLWQRVADALLTLACWAVWLVLGALAAGQAYVLTVRDVRVPRFLIEDFEARLEAAGLRATFGQARFDPTGRLLVQDVRLLAPGYDDPLAEARAVYIRLDPWALLIGRFTPIEERATGVSLRVPAPLSASGRADEIVHDADLEIEPDGRRLKLPYFTGWAGPLAIAACGAAELPAAGPRPVGLLPGAQAFAERYPRWSREVSDLLDQFRQLDRPAVQILVQPAEGGDGARARIVLYADALRVRTPAAIAARGLRAAAILALDADAQRAMAIRLSAESAEVEGIAVQGLRARLDGGVALDTNRRFRFGVKQVRATAASAAKDGLAVQALALAANVSRFPELSGRAVADVGGETVAARFQGDVRAGTARVDVRADLSPALLEAAARRRGMNLGPFVTWEGPVRVSGRARFGPAWKFDGAAGWVSAARVVVRGVRVDEARGLVQFDGRRVVASGGYARMGDDRARGTFTDDLRTGSYRFILDGRLRPLDITPWIAGNWWADFFGGLAFKGPPPSASVDLSGCWTDGRQAAMFIRFDAPEIAVRGVAFDEAQARLFVRPNFDDALDFSVRQGGGTAEGTFTRRYDIGAGELISLDLAVRSTLDPTGIAPLLGDDGRAWIDPFSFTRGPTIQADGRFTGPASPDGVHRDLRVTVRSDRPVSFHGFVLDRAGFETRLKDNDADIDGVTADVAGGKLTGQAEIRGAAPRRRLEFEAAVRNANLARVVAMLSAFSARANGRQPDAASRYIEGEGGARFDLSVGASGVLADAYDFQGAGTAALRGGEIGQLKLFGPLSALLPFTSLRFTQASAAFRIDGPQVIFSAVDAWGANSAISAHGTYFLDRHALNFRCRLNPFQESRALPQKVMDVFLTPLAGVLEVRLTGTIEKPKWVFENGLPNLLRQLSAPKPAAAAAPKPPARPTTPSSQAAAKP